MSGGAAAGVDWICITNDRAVRISVCPKEEVGNLKSKVFVLFGGDWFAEHVQI